MDRTISYLIAQSLRGYHHLFERGIVRFALERAAPGVVSVPIDPETARAAARLLDDLEAERQLDRQRDRIARAPLPVQEVLVRLYFDFIYRYMERTKPILN